MENPASAPSSASGETRTRWLSRLGRAARCPRCSSPKSYEVQVTTGVVTQGGEAATRSERLLRCRACSLTWSPAVREG